MTGSQFKTNRPWKNCSPQSQHPTAQMRVEKKKSRRRSAPPPLWQVLWQNSPSRVLFLLWRINLWIPWRDFSNYHYFGILWWSCSHGVCLLSVKGPTLLWMSKFRMDFSAKMIGTNPEVWREEGGWCETIGLRFVDGRQSQRGGVRPVPSAALAGQVNVT